MKADNRTLQATLNIANQYSIPIFQRFYSWGPKNWMQLWDDVCRIRNADGTLKNHFLGPIVLVSEQYPTGNVHVYHIIDGQQRLLTVSLLLCALRDVASECKLEPLVNEVEESFLINRYGAATTRFKLYPRQRDRDPYVASVTKEGTATGPIGAALEYFTKQVRAMPGGDTEQDLRSFFMALQNGIEFVHIYLTGENPYQIFKSLNSTGVPLSKADLIRNFMFMNLVPEEQDDFYNKLWMPLETLFADNLGNVDGEALAAFFRDFLMMQGRYIKPTETFEAFERHYTTSGFDPHALAKNLLYTANYYAMIRGWRSHPFDAVNKVLTKLRQLDTRTAYPLVLSLFEKTDKGVISEQELIHSIELLSGFILRRLVSNYDSRAYGRLFVSIAGGLGDNPLHGWKKWGNVYAFPDDAQFKNDFLRYRLFESRYAHTILSTLERSYNHKEAVDLSKTQVEHIMPQNLNKGWKMELGVEAERVHTEWLHTPGNLTLTGYNPELSDKPFASKREMYNQSNIHMTRQVGTHDKWTEAEIINRSKELAERVTNIWVGPDE